MEETKQTDDRRPATAGILTSKRLPIYQLIEGQRLALDEKYCGERDLPPNATDWVQLISAEWIELMEFDALNADLEEIQQFLKQTTRMAALAVAAIESVRTLIRKLPVSFDPNDPGIDLSNGPSWQCPLCHAPNTAPPGAEVVECEACGGQFEVDLAAFPVPDDLREPIQKQQEKA